MPKANIPENAALPKSQPALPKPVITTPTASESSAVSNVISPEDLRPYPKASRADPTKKVVRRKRGKSMIATSSPVRSELAANAKVLPKSKLATSQPKTEKKNQY
jgi:hypothetical protein